MSGFRANVFTVFLYPSRGCQKKGQTAVSVQEFSDGRLNYILRQRAGAGQELLLL